MKQNKRYDHVFVIIRVDTFHRAETPWAEMVSVNRVMWDAEAADKEVERLNALNAGKGSSYFAQVARLERKVEVAEAAVTTTAPAETTQKASRNRLPKPLTHAQVPTATLPGGAPTGGAAQHEITLARANLSRLGDRYLNQGFAEEESPPF